MLSSLTTSTGFGVGSGRPVSGESKTIGLGLGLGVGVGVGGKVVGEGAGAALVSGVLLTGGCEAMVPEVPLLHEAISRGTAIAQSPRPALPN
ncbi:unannotated protein [freshwater metagenome]|uniref:Unannotated protein n=1 Tax=freshwater metagenome TaxID=449393 RepID=A0A6J7QCK4_9ZZZZ